MLNLKKTGSDKCSGCEFWERDTCFVCGFVTRQYQANEIRALIRAIKKGGNHSLPLGEKKLQDKIESSDGQI